MKPLISVILILAVLACSIFGYVSLLDADGRGLKYAALFGLGVLAAIGGLIATWCI
jgi:hypothetical protein